MKPTGKRERLFEKHITNTAIQHMVEADESSDALAAATSTRAIGLIDSGDEWPNHEDPLPV